MSLAICRRQTGSSYVPASFSQRNGSDSQKQDSSPAAKINRGKNQMKERRYFSTTVQVRSDGYDMSGVLWGRALSYGKFSKDLGGFREILQPGCFKSTFADPKAYGDIYCTFNHDVSAILGRCRAGNLTVSDSPAGVDFNCKLPDTQTARDVRELVRTGIIHECSFGLIVPDGGDDWGEQDIDPDLLDDTRDGNGALYGDRKKKVHCVVRTVRSASLFDVSVVCDPAYGNDSTSASARSYFPEGIPASVRAHARDLHAIASFQRDSRRKLFNRILGQ
jgi:HK97 family phage prohead protease